MFMIVRAVKGFCSMINFCAGSRGARGACTRLADNRLYFKGVVLET